jgi:hypothetical protein
VSVIGLFLKQWYFDVQRKLNVVVKLSAVDHSRIIEEIISAEIERTPSGSERAGVLGALRWVKSKVDISIENTSKRRIDNTTLELTEGSRAVYERNGETLLLSANMRIELGNLRPGDRVGLIMWLATDPSIVALAQSKILKFSADEIDRVSVSWPFPSFPIVSMLVGRKHGPIIAGMIFSICLIAFFWGRE